MSDNDALAGSRWFRIDWSGDLTRHWNPTAESAGAFGVPRRNGSTRREGGE